MGFFEKFGTITSIYYPKDLQGQPKGFCMINFENKEMAAKAIAEGNKEVTGADGKKTTIYAAYSQSKDERRRRLKREYADSAIGKRACSVIVKWQGKNADKINEQMLTDMFGQFG